MGEEVSKREVDSRNLRKQEYAQELKTLVTKEGHVRMKRGGPTLYVAGKSLYPQHILHSQETTHLQLQQETNQTGPAPENTRIQGRADNRKGTSKTLEDEMHFIYWPQNDWIYR